LECDGGIILSKAAVRSIGSSWIWIPEEERSVKKQLGRLWGKKERNAGIKGWLVKIKLGITSMEHNSKELEGSASLGRPLNLPYGSSRAFVSEEDCNLNGLEVRANDGHRGVNLKRETKDTCRVNSDY